MMAASSMATSAAGQELSCCAASARSIQPSTGPPTLIRVRSALISANLSLWDARVMTAMAPECSALYARSLLVSMVMQGMGTAPIRSTPTMAICHWGMRGSITITRSPWLTSSAFSRFASWHDRRLMSAKVKRCTSPASLAAIRASLSGADAQRSTTSTAKLNFPGGFHWKVLFI